VCVCVLSVARTCVYLSACTCLGGCYAFCLGICVGTLFPSPGAEVRACVPISASERMCRLPACTLPPLALPCHLSVRLSLTLWRRNSLWPMPLHAPRPFLLFAA
jgi:hypothetical protein